MRLAVAGVEDVDLRQLASRLRGASITAFGVDDGGSPSYSSMDAVAFTSPSDQTISQAEHLLRAGRHVMVTAHPLWSEGSLTRLRTAAGQTGARLVVMNPDHYVPSRRLIKQQLEAGKLGEIGLLRLHRWESARAESGNVSPTIAPATWRDLELALWFINKQPSVVYALECTGFADASEAGGVLSSSHLLQLHLGFPGGTMALIDYCAGLPPGDGYCSLSVIGASGAAYADDHQNMQLVYRGGRPLAVRAEEGILGLTDMLQSFVDELRSDRDGSQDLASWRRVGAVANAVMQSVKSRRAIQPEVL